MDARALQASARKCRYNVFAARVSCENADTFKRCSSLLCQLLEIDPI